MIANRFNPLGKSLLNTPAMQYIQDGLIAMWDGVENAKWGKHDANATEWKDLIGGNDLQMDAYVGVTDNAMTNDVTRTSPAFLKTLDAQLSTVLLNADAFTIEIAEDATSSVQYYIWSSPLVKLDNRGTQESSALLLQQVYNRVIGREMFIDVNVTPFFNRHTFAVMINKPLNQSQYFMNGAFKNSATVGAYTNAPAVCTFGITNTMHSIRVYNRALTDEEIAHNYAIDKERFGL